MKIIELNEESYGLWDEFCLSSDEAWFWHTVKWLSYCAAYRESTYETHDLSFMVIDDSGILTICPLMMEKKEGLDGEIHFEFSAAGSGGLVTVPAMRNDLSEVRREKISKAVFEHIDLLAKANQVARATYRMTPLALRYSQFNWLLKYGCLDSSTNTQVIDLTLPLERLWSAIRKGHKHDIHRGEKNYQVHIYDQSNADTAAFDQYRILHHKAAGRITRPLETFEMMYDWIRSGNGMLCGVSKNGRYAGFAYIILYKDSAYYGSASDDPEFETDIPISHVIQWNVIRWLKEKGYKTYEIGVQQFGPQMHDTPTAKDLSISLFKRGFGGRTVPSYRGIKYYDKAFMEADLKNNLNNILSHYQV